ncbi:MAG TPA: right-handed parallel beta-helix repeat-containing protein [Candidatus Cybelea sp.]|jgi:hypothetical protein
MTAAVVGMLFTACSSSLLPRAPEAVGGERIYYVATNGSNANPGTFRRPFRTIQHALDVADRPGNTIQVRGGTYNEGIHFTVDGTAAAPIVLENYPGERPFISGARTSAQKLVQIFDRRHVRMHGFAVGDLVAKSPLESGAIFVEGYGDDVEIADNDVYDVKPAPHEYANGRAIQVRGFYADRPLTNIVISNNRIQRCVVQDGNVLEISGNSSRVTVTNNRLQANRGIALNVTGGTKPPSYTRWTLQVSDVLVAGNQIDGTFGAGAIGLYVQASRRVTVRHNRVEHSGFALYVTSEYPLVHSRNVTIEDNVVRDNAEAGILIGSPFFKTTVLGASVSGNTVLHNGTYESGNGGNFGIGRAIGVRVHKNHLIASDDNALVYLGAPYRAVTLDENCYDTPSHIAKTAQFGYAGKVYAGFSRYQKATRQDGSSTFGRSCD